MPGNPLIVLLLPLTMFFFLLEVSKNVSSLGLGTGCKLRKWELWMNFAVPQYSMSNNFQVASCSCREIRRRILVTKCNLILCCRKRPRLLPCWCNVYVFHKKKNLSRQTNWQGWTQVSPSFVSSFFFLVFFFPFPLTLYFSFFFFFLSCHTPFFSFFPAFHSLLLPLCSFLLSFVPNFLRSISVYKIIVTDSNARSRVMTGFLPQPKLWTLKSTKICILSRISNEG